MEKKIESSKRGGGSSKNHTKKREVGKNKVHCYICENHGHFSNNFWYKKEWENKF